MRVIEVEEKSRDGGKLVLWIVGGAVVGVAAGVLIAERYSGRRASPKSMWRRVRTLARTAGAQWGPLLDLAFELREVWAARSDEREDEEGYEEDEWEEEEDEEEKLDEDLDEDLDELDEEADEEAEDDEDADDLDDEIAGRVVEAFLNDPILSDRDLEIEPGEDGAVILHGAVRYPKEVAHAVTIARGVPGVTGVRQRLEVRRR